MAELLDGISSHELSEWLAYYTVKAERMRALHPAPPTLAPVPAVEAQVLAWFDRYDQRQAGG